MLNSINNKPLFQNGVPITTKKDKKRSWNWYKKYIENCKKVSR